MTIKNRLKSLFNFHAGRDRLINLYNLHGDRVLGDIPICPENNIDPQEIVHAARAAGLGVHVVPDEEKKEHGWLLGTVYVYDRKRLQRVLNENKDMLRAAEWPTQADKFIEYLSWVVAPANTEIYDFIARCHEVNGGDPRRKKATWDDPAQVAYQHQTALQTKMRFKVLKENNPEAVKFFLAGAQQGNFVAQYDMGQFYDRGAGVKQDYAESAFWWGVVAQRGYNTFINFLAQEPEKAKDSMGPHVTPASSEKEIWEATATYSRFPDAAKMRDAAMQHLTPEQRAAVEKRIDDWQPVPALAQPNVQPKSQPSSPLPPGFRVWK